MHRIHIGSYSASFSLLATLALFHGSACDKAEEDRPLTMDEYRETCVDYLRWQAECAGAETDEDMVQTICSGLADQYEEDLACSEAETRFHRCWVDAGCDPSAPVCEAENDEVNVACSDAG
jgi:hypothetical protein